MTAARVPVALLKTAFAVSLLLILFFLVYAIANESGHTSFDPWTGLEVFVPSLILGLARLALQGRGDLWGWMAIAAGTAGIILLAWLDHSCVLLQYEVWIDRGMP